MSTHMKKLIEEGYIDFDKSFINNKPNTKYFITKKGLKKFWEYTESLKKIISYGNDEVPE
jgi:predicted transcriptional regulator